MLLQIHTIISFWLLLCLLTEKRSGLPLSCLVFVRITYISPFLTNKEYESGTFAKNDIFGMGRCVHIDISIWIKKYFFATFSSCPSEQKCHYLIFCHPSHKDKNILLIGVPWVIRPIYKGCGELSPGVSLNHPVHQCRNTFTCLMRISHFTERIYDWTSLQE